MPFSEHKNMSGTVVRRAIALAILAGIAAVSPSVGASPATTHVALGSAVRQGANTTAFSGDGRIAFVAAYGTPEAGTAPTNLVYSVDTATGEIRSSFALTGYDPRGVVYSPLSVGGQSDGHGYVAVRHDGNDWVEDSQNPGTLTLARQAKVDVLTVDPQGQFNLLFALSVPDINSTGNAPLVAPDALDDLAFTADGQQLFFSNCLQMFVYNTQTAVVVPLDGVNAYVDPYAGDQISFFSYDARFGYLSVGVSRNEYYDDPATPDVDEQFVAHAHARVLTFAIAGGAVLLSQTNLNDGDGLSEGSNVVISPDGRYGFVVSVDSGTVYTYRVDTGLVRRTTVVPGLAAASGAADQRGPRSIATTADGTQFALSRSGSIYRPVGRADIYRPVGRSIYRPVGIAESAFVALARTSERGRVTLSGALNSFGEGVSISNVAFDANGTCAYFATSDGALQALSVSTAGDVTSFPVSAVGAGAWSLAYHASTGRAAVVNGMQTDASGSVLDLGGVTLTTVSGAAAKSGSRGVGAPASWDESGSDSISRPVGCSGS